MKNKFYKSTFILILGGLITKILGFIIRVIYTRNIGVLGISLYTLIMPTYSLIITISSFAMPITISKLVSSHTSRSKDILSTSIYIILFISFITMFLIIFFSDFIANILLNEPRVKVLLIGSILSLPPMSLACILKGYFYGKQRMFINTISNIIEQLIRIIFIIFFLPYFTNISITYGVLSFLLINILTESASIITFILFIPKNIKITIKDIKFNKDISHTIISESLPLVSTKIIGNIGYFLEPIILSNTFKYLGYNSSYFLKEYGIYNGYCLSLLLLPSFIIQALCTSLIPEISKYNSNNNIKLVKKRSYEAIILSFIIGLIITLIIYIYKDNLLIILYKTTEGSTYIKYLSLFFILYYLEAPLSSILQALNYSKYTFKTTSIGVLIKLIIMFILCLFKIGMYSLLIAECINIIFVVYKNYYKLKKVLKKKSYLTS